MYGMCTRKNELLERGRYDVYIYRNTCEKSEKAFAPCVHYTCIKYSLYKISNKRFQYIII